MRGDVRLPVVKFFELELQLKNQFVQLLPAVPALNDMKVFPVDHEYLQTVFIEVILDDGLVRRENGAQLSDCHSTLAAQPDEIGVVKLRLSHQFNQGIFASADLLQHFLIYR